MVKGILIGIAGTLIYCHFILNEIRADFVIRFPGTFIPDVVRIDNNLTVVWLSLISIIIIWFLVDKFKKKQSH